MSWLLQLAERRIEEAVERGELQGLPGEGRPLKADETAGKPLEQRVYLQVMRNANVAPREVELLREADLLRDRIAEATDEAERRAHIADLAAVRTELDQKLGGEADGRTQARRRGKAPDLVRGAMIRATGRSSRIP